MEEIIDTITADCIEVGDLIRDYTFDHEPVREVSGVSDEGDEIHVLFEDDDEPVTFSPYDAVHVYGYPEVD